MLPSLNNLRNVLPAALVALMALPSLAQTGSSITSEPYGEPSGPGVIAALGPFLEYAPDADGGSLTLYGGVSGQPAALLVGSASAALPGPDGTLRLVDQGAWMRRGTFDGQGAFRVALTEIPRELLAGPAYAQGVQAGRLAAGPLRREGLALSQGLLLSHAEAQGPLTGGPGVLRSHLPAERRAELDSAFGEGDLAYFLTSALDSDGDTVAVKLEADFSINVYPGVGVGAKGSFEAQVTRESASAFTVSLERDAAVLAAVGAGDYIGVEGACGLSESVFFTFPSAAGAARGVFGLWMAQNMPPALPMPSGALVDAAEQAWAQARERVAGASVQLGRARTALAGAGRGRSGWVALAARGIALQVLHAAQSVLDAALRIEAQAGSRVAAARAQFEGLLEGFWKVQRVVHELDSARRYADLHRGGVELGFVTTGEFKLCLIGGTVQIQGCDVGFKLGLERQVAVRIDEADQPGGPSQVAVKLSSKKSREAWAGMHFGGRAAFENALVAHIALEVGPGASSDVDTRLALEFDAWARSEVSLALGSPITRLPGVVSTSGVGRMASVTTSLDYMLEAAGSIGEEDAGFVNLPCDLDLSDYRIEGYAAKYGLSVDNTGGSVGLQAQVKDAGQQVDLDGISGRRVIQAFERAVDEWIAPQS